MAKLSNTLQQKMTVRLSPDQILVARLLEIPSVELLQRVNEELQENPVLEEGSVSEDTTDENDEYNAEESETADRLEEDEASEEQIAEAEYKEEAEELPDSDDGEFVIYSPPQSEAKNTADFGMSATVSIIDYLKSQIYLTKMDKPQRHIAKWVIGNIDDEGFLRRTAEQLANDLYFQEGLQVEKGTMEDILSQIRRFDPPGIASFSLKDCLLYQIQHKKSTPAITNACNILEKCFDLFSKHRYDAICDKLKLTHEQLHDAVAEITRLNPKPINAFTEGNSHNEKLQSAIIPDFYIETRDGDLFLSLNTSNIPNLYVSKNYEQMLSQYEAKGGQAKNKPTIKFLKGKISDARLFIKAIQIRNETLFNTMSAIMHFQKDFFLEGDSAYLKPMILQDVAEKTGYDISTISRVSNSKYVQTDFGIFPLRYFFSDAYQKSDGEQISTRELKHTLTDIIKNEDKNAPLSDDQLVKKMEEQGYKIARRTITKYRKLLNIPVANLRRNI